MIKLNCKIFGIGLSKTGTTSLTESMKILGIKARHNPKHPGDIIKAQFCSDIMVAILFKHLAEKYPDAKFIYTVRRMEQWLISCEAHFKKKLSYIDVLSYRSLEFNREHWRKVYLQHDYEVKKYFNKKNRGILIIDIERENEKIWDKLCEFLEIEKPTFLPKFPRRNVTSELN